MVDYYIKIVFSRHKRAVVPTISRHHDSVYKICANSGQTKISAWKREGGDYEFLAHAEQLLAPDSCGKRENQFSLRLRRLVGQLPSSGWSYTQYLVGQPHSSGWPYTQYLIGQQYSSGWPYTQQWMGSTNQTQGLHEAGGRQEYEGESVKN